MNSKKCPLCSSFNVIRKGFHRDIQRWYCKECKKKFLSNRKAPLTKEELFCLFTFHKQTLKELKKVYHLRTSSLQKLLDEYSMPKVIHNPGKIYLIVDATYFGSKENIFCVIVFRDALSKKNLWWSFEKTETDFAYRRGRKYLEGLGYTILSVTADGLPLIHSVFMDIPFQMCLVHMERIIVRGTTRKPKLEAGKVLLALGESIHSMPSEVFRRYMYKFTLKYFHFLQEKTISPETGESWFTHEPLRNVFLSLQRLQEHLFTYEKDSKIPKTSNSLEGCFTHIKIKLAVHHGLSLPRKKKLIEAMLYFGAGVDGMG